MLNIRNYVLTVSHIQIDNQSPWQNRLQLVLPTCIRPTQKGFIKKIVYPRQRTTGPRIDLLGQIKLVGQSDIANQFLESIQQGQLDLPPTKNEENRILKGMGEMDSCIILEGLIGHPSK